jgi:hypothetical protein
MDCFNDNNPVFGLDQVKQVGKSSIPRAKRGRNKMPPLNRGTQVVSRDKNFGLTKSVPVDKHQPSGRLIKIFWG